MNLTSHLDCSSMATPQEPTEHEVYLAQLNCSDEDTEALLSGGADIDDLIASGTLPTDTQGWGWQLADDTPEGLTHPAPLTEADVLARHEAHHAWLVANGHCSPTWRSEKGYGQLSDQPH